MQIELHRNNVYLGAELLLLVSMLFLLAIPKCLVIFKENFYYTSKTVIYLCILGTSMHSFRIICTNGTTVANSSCNVQGLHCCLLF